MTTRLPYPGLRGYGREETDLFFGREDAVNDMVDRLAARHFLAVLGASGSGKSSLVRTGLLDALELGLLAAAGPRWLIADSHPGGSAIRNLAAALLRATAQDVPMQSEVDALDAFLRRGPRSIVEWVADGNLPAGHNLLLLIDQFEELFRYGDYAGREEAEAFATLLLESARAGVGIHVVVTMRSEYLGACALIPGLAEQINSSLYLTRRMTREEYRQAIEGPAAVCGFDIEPQLVSRLLNDLSTLAPWETDRENSQLQRLSRQADQLPLMQHALSRLWQLAARRGAGGRLLLRLQDYLDIGQLQGALDQHAREVTARLSEAARPVVAPVFRALVSGSDLIDAVRKPMRLGPLVSVVGADEALVREVVDTFRARDCNFLRPPEGVALFDDTVIDISHESLIRQWSSLTEWFAEEAQSSALWARLSQSAERHAAGQGELLSGLDLANALDWWKRQGPTKGWANGHGGKFAKIERYLNASRGREEQTTIDVKARQRQERNRLNVTIAAVFGFAIVCLALAAWAFSERQSAQASLADKEMARSDAQASLERMEQARRDAQSANDRSLSVVDHFVVNMVDRLRVIPGISNELIKTYLKDGEEFLNELATHQLDKRRIALSQARFAAVAGNMLLDSDDYAEALKLTTAAEAQLAGVVAGGGYSRAEALVLLEIEDETATGLNGLGRPGESGAKAEQAVSLADAQAGTGTMDGEFLMERAKARLALAYALIDLGKLEDSLNAANQCLSDISNETVTASPERDYIAGRCHISLSYCAIRLRLGFEALGHSYLATQSLARIAANEKSIPMRLAESDALSNLAIELTIAENPDDPEFVSDELHRTRDRSASLFLQAEKVVDLTNIDIRQNTRLRMWLMRREINLGRFYLQWKDYGDAKKWFEKAASNGTIDENWRGITGIATELDTALDNLSIAISNLSWTNDRELIADFERTEKTLLDVRHVLLQNGNAPWCIGCELPEKQERFAALVRFDRVRNENRFEDALALADEIIAEAKEVLANPPSDIHVINARRAWSRTVNLLVAAPEDMPSITEPLRQIDVLTASRTRIAEFRSFNPKAWYTERQLGWIDANLAKLYAGLGRKEEAVSMALEGANMFNKLSTELLADWYSTGSGPTPQNLEKAKIYSGIISSRNWYLVNLQIKARFLWKKDNELYNYPVLLEDPRSEDDDPVTRLIWQLENIEGVQITEEYKTKLNKLLDDARSNHRSFIESADDEFGISVPSENLAGRLKRSMRVGNVDEAAAELSRQWERVEGPATVNEAVRKLLDEGPQHETVKTLLDIAAKVSNAALAETILGVEISKPALERDDISALYSLRGAKRQTLGRAADAETDYSLALALRPTDPQLLNELAYLWVAQDRNLKAAIELLDRAVAAAPDDADIRDSLGWAYVKSGETEKGLALLVSAATQAPDDPVVLTHLGDAHRRLGHNDEAAVALEHAAKFAEDDTQRADIQHQLMLIGRDKP